MLNGLPLGRMNFSPWPLQLLHLAIIGLRPNNRWATGIPANARNEYLDSGTSGLTVASSPIGPHDGLRLMDRILFACSARKLFPSYGSSPPSIPLPIFQIEDGDWLDLDLDFTRAVAGRADAIIDIVRTAAIAQDATFGLTDFTIDEACVHLIFLHGHAERPARCSIRPASSRYWTILAAS